MFKRLTPINLVIIITIVIAAAAIAANHWPAATVKGEPPTTYAEAVAMRNAALNALHKLERETDAAEPTERKRLIAGIEAQVAEWQRLERRIDELK